MNRALYTNPSHGMGWMTIPHSSHVYYSHIISLIINPHYLHYNPCNCGWLMQSHLFPDYPIAYPSNLTIEHVQSVIFQKICHDMSNHIYIYNLPHPHRICVFLILQLNSNANLLRICPHFVFMFFLPIWSSLWKDFIKGKGGPPFKSYSGGQDSRMRKSEKGFHMVFGDKN